MNYQKISKLTLLIVLPLLLWGCFEDHASNFHLDDINQVEWAPPNRATSNLSYTANLAADQTEPKIVTLQVQLIGAQSSNARTAGVRAAAGDAQEGTDFEILNSEVVIPANSNHGDVEIRINSANLDNGDNVNVILELTEGPELGVAVNLKDFNLRIQKAN